VCRVQLVVIVRCAQLSAHATAALEDKPLSLLGQCQPPPVSWLSKALMSRLAALVPLEEKTLRGRLLNYSQQAALPEVRRRRRRYSPTVEGLFYTSNLNALLFLGRRSRRRRSGGDP